MSVLEIDQLPSKHPCARFYAFWHSHLNDMGLFERASFSPMTMPKVLPWMAVLDKVSKSAEEQAELSLPDWQQERDYWFIYRLCGTGYSHIVGKDLTGQLLGAQQSSEDALVTYKRVESAISSRDPVFLQERMPIEGREFMQIIRSAFPVSKSGTEIDQVITMIAAIDCVA